jgi:CspA family cold shock protein
MTQGTVKFINIKEGYGFIAVDDKGPYAFFRSQTAQGAAFETFAQEQQVEFEITQGPMGPHPENIRPLGRSSRTLH